MKNQSRGSNPFECGIFLHPRYVSRKRHVVKQITIMLMLCIYQHPSYASQFGSVCLGENRSLLLDEHTQVHLTIDGGEPIRFVRPYHDIPPRIVVTGLDLHIDHDVRIYFKNQVVESWKFNFTNLEFTAVHIWRGGGGWGMEAIEIGACRDAT